MKFTYEPRTQHVGWLHLNDSPTGFCQLYTNGYKSKGPDPELVRACTLIKAAPEVLEACEGLLAALDEVLPQAFPQIVLQDYGKLNETLIAARRLISEIRQP